MNTAFRPAITACVPVLALALLLPVSCVSPAAPAASIPPEIAQKAGGWPAANQGYDNTRCAAASSIDSGNVRTLGVLWSVPVAGLAKGNPIIADEVVYYQDFMRNVFAVDIYGNIRWQRRYDSPSPGPTGVAVGWGKVFAPAGLNEVAALDISDGQELWSSTLSENVTEIANIQPAVYDGMVFLSTSTAGLTQTTVGGNTGKIYALDEKTGMIRWNFDTVDSKNVWGNPTVNGGGGCYFPPAVETSTGLTYWGTDGPAPFPGTDRFPNGSSRPGANRYTNSMLALNAARGSLQWASQTAPHDLFGRSLTASPILATVEIGGLQKDIVIGSGETGTVSAFNRKDGTLLWATPVGRHENDGLTRLPDAVTRVYPAAHGGVEMPMALCEGTLYAAANNTYADFTQADCSPQSILDGDSEFVAMAIDSGKVIWDKHLDAVATSPPTVVNDLVLLGTLDGNVHALDRNSGQELWTYHASPDTSTGWAAVGGDTIVVAVNKDGIPSLLALKPGADRPYVNVVSPVNDSWISPESDVTVTVQVFNFNITDNVDAPNRSGEGHLIYYLNVDAATAPGKSALTTPGTYAISSTTSHTWKGLPMIPDGGYGFWVQLVNNDNTPLVPPALDVASVNIVGFHPD